MFGKVPEISLCIPVFGTEEVLPECLQSIRELNFPENVKNFLEVVVLDDCSKPQNKSAEQIVKEFKKTVKFPVHFIRHDENKGLVETRKDLVFEAKGKFVVFLDSDDTLPKNGLLSLYKKEIETGADIVQGKGFVVGKNLSEEERKSKYITKLSEKISNICPEQMISKSYKENQILDGYLIKQNHNGFLWGKLYKREMFLEAVSHIPPIFCIMAEDILIYIWCCYEAKSYASVDEYVYNYSVDAGISSQVLIKDLARWEKVCSAASVFTALFVELDEIPEENKPSEENIKSIQQLCRNFLANNLLQYEKVVVPEIKEEAHKMLCDFWGQDFVELAEKTIAENKTGEKI